MTIVVKDRVRESTVSAGTGNLQLIGAVSGFQSFAALGDDPEIDTYYAVLDSALGAWETGYGKYIPETQTLVRVEVLESSAANELVDFAPTVKDVFCVYPASKAVTLDEIGNLTLQSLTVVEPIVGGITGNAGTVTGGVYTTGDQTVDGEKTFLQPIAGDITGNAGTVTNGVYTTGDQTVDGEKTFLQPIVGDITGNAGTVTNGVYLDAEQTLTSKTLDAVQLDGGYTEEVFEVTGTTPALSPTNGSIQTWVLTGNSTPTSGAWASGQSLTLMVDDGDAYAITWSGLSVVWKTGAGTAPTLPPSGLTAIQLWKVGSVLYGARVGDA